MGRSEPKRSSRVSRILTAASSETSPDLAQRVSAINDVAKTVRTLLASMAAVAIAMAATMIAATDEAIFRDSAKVFPSLSVEIRLSTAFTLAPPIFVFLHLNALLQLHLLTRRLRAFLAVLNEGRHDEHSREAWLRQLHGLSFVQMLLPDRQGNLGRLLQAIASWISVVGLPVLLLLAVQVSFVRYQSWAITIIHMVSLGADMALLMWFQLSLWPNYWKRLTALVAPGLLVALIMTQAIPPEEIEGSRNLFDTVISRVQGFAWTRRTLSLPGAVLINTDAKPDLLKPLSPGSPTLRSTQTKMLRLSVPNRNFVGIDLEEAEMFSINMEGSNLREAKLIGTQMREANLSHAQMQRANLKSAQLPGADLKFAQMQEINLEATQMQGAKLTEARMQGAKLKETLLQGADLSGARLRGGILRDAQMQGSNLVNTQMHGAKLSGTQFQGANLSNAYMPGAMISNSDFRGAFGRLLDCTAVFAWDYDGPPPLTRENFVQLLEASGLANKVIDSQLEGYENHGALQCPGLNMTLWERLYPTESELGEEWRDLSCADPIVARSLWRSFPDSMLNHQLVTMAMLAHPPGKDCPGLRAVPAYIRRDMDDFWASLSPEQQREFRINEPTGPFEGRPRMFYPD